jgi:hypothetical protein
MHSRRCNRGKTEIFIKTNFSFEPIDFVIVVSIGYQSSEKIIFVRRPENAKARSLRIGPFFLLLIMSMA